MTTSTKGEKDSPALGKGESSKSFHEMVNLITGFFPCAKLDSPSSSLESFPWLDVVNVFQRRGPRIFLTLFEKLEAVSKEVFEKFRKATDGRKTSSALPTWGDVYRLSNLPEFHKAPKLNESFSRLLEKMLAASRSIALSLNETCKLERCLRGMIESQSFAPGALSAVFEFLHYSNCVPDNPLFGHPVSSMTVAINLQAKASFSAATFLQHKRRETYVSHLPVATHPSVKHTLLSTLSSMELFNEDVIQSSLTQVKDDSQLLLLRNLLLRVRSSLPRLLPPRVSVAVALRLGSFRLALARSQGNLTGQSVRLPSPLEGSRRFRLVESCILLPLRRVL